jgi:hypothetical protein
VDDQRLYMGHELMHCYEAAIQGSIAVFGPSPAWLIEGAAEWAGALVAGSTADTISLQASWVGWLVNPTFPLFQRAYSAIGFYALLDHAGISPWSVLPAMLTSQSNGPNNLAAYQAGTQPAPQEVLDEWASSYERDTSLGLDWDLTGPGIIPASIYGGPKTQSLALGDGQSSSVSTPAYAATDAHLTSQAEVVEVTISGTSRLIDSANLERITSADGAYCTKQGGCTCPQGSAYQGPPLTQLTGLVHLALTGGSGGATGSVSGLTLQQFCNQKKKPTSPPQVTQQWCESVMTVADANQIMHPPTPATTIFAQADAELGVCSYIYSQTQPAIVKILVEETPYSGPNPVPQATIGQLVAQLENDPGATVTTQTPVSGVGDQAEFLAATDAQNTLTLYVDVIYVLYGNVAFLCDDFHFNVKPDDAAQLSALQQCAQRVVARLDP